MVEATGARRKQRRKVDVCDEVNLMITYYHPHRVRYRECDPMGVVYHTHFVDYFEISRTELIRKLGVPYKEIEASGLFIQVVEVNVRYHKPVFYDDDLEIATIIAEEPAIRVNLKNEVRRKGESDILTSGLITLCFVDATRMRPVRVPDYFSRAVRHALDNPTEFL